MRFCRVSLAILIFAALLAVSWVWFAPWRPSVFYGDDLSNLLAFYRGEFASSWHQAFTSVYSDKFRPVFAAAMHVLFSSFGPRLEGYMAANMLVHALSGTLIFFSAAHLSARNWAIAVGLSLAFVLSRLSIYQVTQVTGLVEGLGNFFFLCMLLNLIRASAQASWRWSLFAFLFAVAASFTHERYIIVLPWLMAAFMLLPGMASFSGRHKLRFAALCVSAVAVNVLYKLLFGSGHFFVGTGGVNMDFAQSRTIDNLMQALLSIFGFNHGPDYLVGAEWSVLPYRSGWILASAMSLAFVALIGMALWPGHKKRFAGPPLSGGAWGGLLVLLAILMLVPPALTIRMEPRWELQPFILLLLMLAWAYGRVCERWGQWGRNTAISAVAVFSLASAGVDVQLSHYFDRIYLFSSERVAALVKRDVVANKPDAVPEHVIFILSKDHCNWTLINGNFFRVYANKHRTVSCVDSIADVVPGVETRIYADTGERLADITAEFTKTLQERAATSFDFLQAYDQGVINDTTPVSTPSGLGAVRMSWDSTVGRQPTLVLLSSFSYRFDKVRVRKGDELRFGLAMLYPAPQAATASVEIRDSRGQLINRYSQDLRPPIKGARAEFKPVAISFDEIAEQEVSVIFSAMPSGEDLTGQWVGFSMPRLIHTVEMASNEGSAKVLELKKSR